MYIKKKLLSVCLVLGISITMFTSFSMPWAAVSVWDGSIATGYEGGSGTKDDPYQIANAAQFAYFLDKCDKTYYKKYFLLTNDIIINDASKFKYNSVGEIIGVVSEGSMRMLPKSNKRALNNVILNSKGAKISGLYMEPLFQSMYNSVMTNIAISGSYFTQGASFVYDMTNSDLFYCLNFSPVAGDDSQTGGIVASMTDSGVYWCANTAKVSASGCTGGIAGTVDGSNSSEILGCLNFGYITSSNSYAGGIVGHAVSSNYEKFIYVFSCANRGDIKAYNSYSAGIVANSYLTVVANCYNTGGISSDFISAGIANNTEHALVMACYNIGTVWSSRQSYAISYQDEYEDTYVKDCYYMDSCGAGGPGTSLYEYQMKNISGFPGFNFDEIWTIDSSSGYEYPQPMGVVSPFFEATSMGVTISGAVEIGQVLTADVKTNKSGADLTYVWISGDKVVQEGSQNTLLISENITGRKIVCYVFSSGRYIGCGFSNTIDLVIPISGLKITGLPEYSRTLTAQLDQEGVTAVYQWKRDGVAILGATGKTYIPTADDIGKQISVTVSGKGSYKGILTSKAVSVTECILTGSVSVFGRLQAQTTVSANLKKLSPENAEITYQWYLDDEVVKDADKNYFELTDSMVGSKVTLKITGNGLFNGEFESSFTVKEYKIVKGDIDADGRINLADAMKTFQHVAGKIELTGDYALCADINCNDKVELNDAMKIFQYVAGKINKF